jgi:hypothetical protein
LKIDVLLGRLGQSSVVPWSEDQARVTGRKLPMYAVHHAARQVGHDIALPTHG